jgi:hypothetical protein
LFFIKKNKKTTHTTVYTVQVLTFAGLVEFLSQNGGTISQQEQDI